VHDVVTHGGLVRSSVWATIHRSRTGRVPLFRYPGCAVARPATARAQTL